MQSGWFFSLALFSVHIFLCVLFYWFRIILNVSFCFAVWFLFLLLSFQGESSAETDGETKQIATIVYTSLAFFSLRSLNAGNLITLMIAQMEKWTQTTKAQVGKKIVDSIMKWKWGCLYVRAESKEVGISKQISFDYLLLLLFFHSAHIWYACGSNGISERIYQFIKL